MTNSVQRIANNTFFSLGSKTIELVSGVIIIVMAARYLGVEQFGQYAFIRSIGFILSAFIAMGSLRIMVRDISVHQEKAGSIMASGIILRCITGTVVLIGVYLFLPVLDLQSNILVQGLFVAICSQILMDMTLAVYAGFTGFERMKFNFGVTLINRSVLIILFILVIIYDFEIIGLFLSLFLANLLAFILALSLLHKKFFVLKFSTAFKGLINLLRSSYPLAITALLIQGHMNVNVFFLKYYQEFEQISYFQAPQRIIIPLILISQSLLVSFLPVLSRMAHNKDIADFIGIYHSILKGIVIFTLPIILFVTLDAKHIIYMVFGIEYQPAVLSLQVLIWTLLPAFINSLLQYVLIIKQKEKKLIIGSSICLIVNTLLSILLIPQYGYIGASFSFMFSFISLCCVNMYFVSMEAITYGDSKLMIKVLTLSLVSLAFILFYSEHVSSLISHVLLFILLSALFLILNIVTHADKAMIQKAFRLYFEN